MEPGLLAETLAAVQTAPAVAALRASRFAYPLVNTAHVLGLALLYGSVVAMDLAVLGAWRGLAARPFVRTLRPLAVAGVAVALPTGAALFAVRASEYAAMPVMVAKLVLLAIALVNAAGFVALAERGEKPFGPRARLAAALSLALWTGVVVAGRFIGYAG